MKRLIIPKQIVTVNKSFEILRDHAVEIIDGRITRIVNLQDINIDKFDGEIGHFNNYTLMPGFVQTHVHLCQSLFRGLADDMELLDWLQKRIFPYENNHTKNSLKTSAQLG
ncbi:MAG: amidohydrolase family protein, partial [Melioribacteraceae bacterium]|nr:amidohydrolase family protein [Melioribacteraceae bacterium]